MVFVSLNFRCLHTPQGLFMVNKGLDKEPVNIKAQFFQLHAGKFSDTKHAPSSIGFMVTYSNRDVYTTGISYLAISFRSKVHKVSLTADFNKRVQQRKMKIQ